MGNTTEAQKVTSEEDLEKKSKRDNYNIQRFIKYAVGICIIIVLLSLTILFLVSLCTDKSLQQFVIEKIKENITAVVLAGFYVVGINLVKKP